MRRSSFRVWTRANHAAQTALIWVLVGCETVLFVSLVTANVSAFLAGYIGALLTVVAFYAISIGEWLGLRRANA